MNTANLRTRPTIGGRAVPSLRAEQPRRSSLMATRPPQSTTRLLPGQTAADQRRADDQLAERAVPALIPARQARETHSTGLPVARLMSARRVSSLCYALTRVDDRGRLADRSLLRDLRWGPGHPIELTVVPGPAVLVAPVTGGRHAINRQGHLRLPASIRHSCGLVPGDRLLMAADREQQIVVAYTIAALDAIILAWHTSCGVAGRP
jgi:hypothetical protein